MFEVRAWRKSCGETTQTSERDASSLHSIDYLFVLSTNPSFPSSHTSPTSIPSCRTSTFHHHGHGARSRRWSCRRSFLRTFTTVHLVAQARPTGQQSLISDLGSRRSSRLTKIPRRHKCAGTGILQGRLREDDESEGGGTNTGDAVCPRCPHLGRKNTAGGGKARTEC